MKPTILQIHIGEIHPERQACIDSVRNIYSDCEYIFIDKPDIENLHDMVMFSDWLRLKMLSDNPNMLYIDTDIMLYGRLDQYFTQRGKPYMLHLQNNCLIYSNNCCDWFKSFIRKSLANNNFGKIVTCNMYSHTEVYSIPRESVYHISGAGQEKHWHQTRAL